MIAPASGGAGEECPLPVDRRRASPHVTNSLPPSPYFIQWKIPQLLLALHLCSPSSLQKGCQKHFSARKEGNIAGLTEATMSTERTVLS